MRLYGAFGAAAGFLFGSGTGYFAAWFVMDWLVQCLPVVAGSGPVFVGLWAAHIVLASVAFALAGILLRRFEIFLESERPRQDPL
ncbi:MAG: hypothetical protein M3552_08335 [Planctomycetota bacterium]|nr:hypothetical protein [Planctomycetota bacterium]